MFDALKVFIASILTTVALILNPVPKIIQEKNSEAADYSGIVNDFGKEFSTSFDETKSTTTKTLPKGINQDLL
jgi:hypothetical protein